MFKLPDFPSIDFPSVDFPSVDFSKLDLNALRNIDLSKYVPTNIDLKSIEPGTFAAALRDAAYITVGFGVVAIEQAQTRRRQLVTALGERFGASKSQVEMLLSTFEARIGRIDEQVDAIEAQIDTLATKFEGILPDQAGALLGQARELGKGARKQVRGLFSTAA